jgi:hypothetical protein
MEWFRDPELPLMVTVYVPGTAVVVLLKYKVLALVVVGFGLNEVVTPLGTPVAENLTLPAKPLTGFIVIAMVACEDSGMLTLLGDVVTVKSGAAAVTVKVTVVECIIAPPEPVTVIG